MHRILGNYNIINNCIKIFIHRNNNNSFTC